MQRSNITIIARLTGLAKPLLPVMTVAVLMGVAGHLCATFLSVFAGWALLSLMGFWAPAAIKRLLMLIVLCAVFRAVLRYAEQATNHYIAFRLLAEIRDKVFRALCRLAPAKLEGRNRGDLISLITSDVELLEVYYAHTISPVLIALLFGILTTGVISWYHPFLGMLSAAAYLIIGVCIPVITYRASRMRGQQLRDEMGELSALILDGLRGMDTCIQYGCGEEKLREVSEKTDALAALQRRISRDTSAGDAAASTAVWIFSLLMLGAGLSLYIQGAVDFSGAVIPALALIGSFGPVLALANLAANLTQTLASGSRVLDVLDEVPVMQEVSRGKTPAFTGIECRQVSFAYGEKTVLQKANALIAPGKITGLNGPSGAGKSTLLRLMMRFWDVSSGEILFSGINLKEVDTGHLRTLQSLVTQETVLFNESLEANIKIGKLSATREEVTEACKKAAIHDFIMSLPQGYETVAGELGSRLSSGERQRIGLARAFLHDAPLMLLDEPTSNLDSLNESVILKALHESRQGKTIVLVSHRGSTMGIADTLYHVQGGQTKEGAKA